MIFKATLCKSWKSVVKSTVMERERAEIVATMIMYKNLCVFKKLDIVQSGFIWWYVARINTQLLYKVKVMFKMLVTNNEKCGYICGCDAKQDICHILFNCTRNDMVRDELYNKMVDEMPEALKMDFEGMSNEAKVTLLYNCYGSFIREWMTLYKTTVNFMYSLCKLWYQSLE